MTYRNEGEYWYRDAQPLLKRMRRWLFSCGWESPHWTAAGYSYRWCPRVSLALRARGDRSWLFALYRSLCPLSLFGGRLTFQPFGVGYWSRRQQRWYCIHRHKTQSPRWYAYRSHDATPSGADTWYFGVSREVLHAANQQAERMTDAREAREQREATA